MIQEIHHLADVVYIAPSRERAIAPLSSFVANLSINTLVRTNLSTDYVGSLISFSHRCII